MVKHIVLFKLKEELGQAEKQDVMNRFKAVSKPCLHAYLSSATSLSAST